MVRTLSDMGLCAARAHYDYEIIQVKLDNEVSEDYDIISADGFIRRGGGTYRQSCTPAAFPIPRPADAPPPGSGCGWPYPPPVSRIKVKVHLSGTDFDTLDATPLVGHDALYCAAIGYTDGRTPVPGPPGRRPRAGGLRGLGRRAGRGHRPGRADLDQPRRRVLHRPPVTGCANADNQYSLWVYGAGPVHGLRRQRGLWLGRGRLILEGGAVGPRVSGQGVSDRASTEVALLGPCSRALTPPYPFGTFAVPASGAWLSGRALP